MLFRSLGRARHPPNIPRRAIPRPPPPPLRARTNSPRPPPSRARRRAAVIRSAAGVLRQPARAAPPRPVLIELPPPHPIPTQDTYCGKHARRPSHSSRALAADSEAALPAARQWRPRVAGRAQAVGILLLQTSSRPGCWQPHLKGHFGREGPAWGEGTQSEGSLQRPGRCS